MSINEDKLHELLGKGVNDFGATMAAAMVVIGDELGLYKALAEGGAQTSTELAERTQTAERYVREWLASQAASGYVSYDAENKKFYLTEEQAFIFANDNSPAFLPGAFQVALAATKAAPKIAQAFRTGEGFGWHEHHADLFLGTERFFRPGYAANLMNAWIPTLDGVEMKLRDGAKVADVGCGHGSSTILMAQAFPNSTFLGFDYHPASIEKAKERATAAGVEDRVTFKVAAAKQYPGNDYDFVTFFDCLHDMGDPVGAAAHVLQSLKADGTWMIVEPFANDDAAENLNPVGRVFYSASTLICTPASLAQEVGLALGAQAGEAKLRDVVMQGGFRQFRRATETPFNIIFEAKP
ncbi:MAG: class I SAM-dependent methyltransferase [Acidobacteriota bacterium]